MSDLKERLRKTDPFVNDPISLKPRLRNPDGPEAADRIEALEGLLGECKRRASLIAIVEQGCGGNLSFQQMANSAMQQARDLEATIDAILSQGGE